VGDIRGGISVSVRWRAPGPSRSDGRPARLGTSGVVDGRPGRHRVFRRSLEKGILAREQASADLQREVRERQLAEGQLREANERYEPCWLGRGRSLGLGRSPSHRGLLGAVEGHAGSGRDEVSDAEGNGARAFTRRTRPG